MPISRRYAYRNSDDSYLRRRHRFYNLTPTQRYREVLFEKWTMAAIWIAAMQEYWSDKQPGDTLSLHAYSGDTYEDVGQTIRLAHDSLVDRYGPSEEPARSAYNHLVDRYGSPEIPCEYAKMGLAEILLGTDSNTFIP